LNAIQFKEAARLYLIIAGFVMEKNWMATDLCGKAAMVLSLRPQEFYD
jgi:hypothetical protein